jgi:lipopolysaccharide/colanic/teichoic acid biosynthesis glycosyltransferase
MVKAAAAALTAALSFTLMRLDGVPRSLPILHFLILAAGIIGARWFRSEHFRRLDQPDQDAMENVLIIGATQLACLYIRMQAFMPGRRQRIVAMLDDNPRMSGRSFSGIPVLGASAKCEAVLREYATHGVFIRRVLVAHHDQHVRDAAQRQLAACCADRAIRLELLADRFLVSGDIAPEEGLVATLDAPLASGYAAVRRSLERFAASLALVVLSPLLVVVALCVLIDVGAPIVFWQERVGRFGKSIFVHKFRTLCASVDRHGAPIPEDRRLSKIGALLRATRLDELPQVYDIARGAMSLIGPRPLLPVDMPEDSFIRQQATPGITGWAQVNGGKLITIEEKNALDEWYIAHMSPAIDLQIIWRTIRTTLCGDRRDEAAVQQALRFREERLCAVAPINKSLSRNEEMQPLIFRQHSA